MTGAATKSSDSLVHSFERGEVATQVEPLYDSCTTSVGSFRSYSWRCRAPLDGLLAWLPC